MLILKLPKATIYFFIKYSKQLSWFNKNPVHQQSAKKTHPSNKIYYSLPHTKQKHNNIISSASSHVPHTAFTFLFLDSSRPSQGDWMRLGLPHPVSTTVDTARLLLHYHQQRYLPHRWGEGRGRPWQGDNNIYTQSFPTKKHNTT